MSIIVWTYLGYLAISILLTIWVARTLHKSGRVFLVDVFKREDLADSVNHLLVVGFYLVNLGYVSLALATRKDVLALRGGIEMLSTKVGGVLLVLGFMHFFNLYVFSRLRRRAQLRTSPPPLPPDARVRPPRPPAGPPRAPEQAPAAPAAR